MELNRAFDFWTLDLLLNGCNIKFFDAQVTSVELVFFETTKHNLCPSRFTHQTQSNEIHWSAFDWVWLPKANLMDCVRLDKICFIEFNWVRNLTPTKFSVWFGLIGELNWIQSTDWVWFPNVQLTMPGIQGFSLSLSGVFCLAFSKTEIWWQGPWQWIRFKLFWIWRWRCTGEF